MANKLVIAILGAGFIGKNLIRHFLSMGGNVRVLDHNDCPEEFRGKVFWLKAKFDDRTSINNILDANVDVAYHMISSTVPGSDTDKKIIQELYENVFTTIEFINVCLKVKVRRIVFLSSSSVYGIQNVFPIKETAQTNPISAHGIQKLAIEKYFQLFQYIENIDIKIVRLSNPYGPGQNLNGKQGFIAIAIGSIIENKELLIRNNGDAIRDYIYIDDAVNALMMIGIKKNIPTVINIGSGVPYTLKEVLSIIEMTLNKKAKKNFGEDRKIDIPKSILNIELAENKLGFYPKVKLQEGIKKTLKYHGLIS
jgi:UDP-glucose 4-epimerase